eukprot:TRINITY_DN111254_c0_g1_i1.p1 TRINITY_DN111254_c0_g1~~TRINITY_DN111254_c0_g1_i1.p1  ORF type:complete len:1043 (+),score=231.29 TRINITY_DN111254_c0_g1_i1:87-3215(+)
MPCDGNGAISAVSLHDDASVRGSGKSAGHYECVYDCGFKGDFDTVAFHEMSCMSSLETPSGGPLPAMAAAAAAAARGADEAAGESSEGKRPSSSPPTGRRLRRKTPPQDLPTPRKMARPRVHPLALALRPQDAKKSPKELLASIRQLQQSEAQTRKRPASAAAEHAPASSSSTSASTPLAATSAVAPLAVQSHAVLPYTPGGAGSRFVAADTGSAATEEQTAWVPRGHYDVLRITKKATQQQVHSAYRRRALITHPDKGGDAEAFQRVVQAFEVLSDPTARWEYDYNCNFEDITDGLPDDQMPVDAAPGTPAAGTPAAGTAAPGTPGLRSRAIPRTPAPWTNAQGLPRTPAPATPGVAAPQSDRIILGRARCAHLLLLGDEYIWKQYEQKKKLDTYSLCLEYSDALLLVLVDLLRGKSPSGETSRCDDDNMEDKKDQRKVAEGIYSHKDRYFVQVTWENFRLRSQLTPSLMEALNWQINMTQLRHRCQFRLKEKPSPPAIPAEEEAEKKDNTAKVRDPLTREELQELLRLEPDLELRFASVFFKNDTKCTGAPLAELASLDLALELHRHFSSFMTTGPKKKDFKAEKKLKMSELKPKVQAWKMYGNWLSQQLVGEVARRRRSGQAPSLSQAARSRPAEPRLKRPRKLFSPRQKLRLSHSTQEAAPCRDEERGFFPSPEAKQESVAEQLLAALRLDEATASALIRQARSMKPSVLRHRLKSAFGVDVGASSSSKASGPRPSLQIQEAANGRWRAEARGLGKQAKRALPIENAQPAATSLALSLAVPEKRRRVGDSAEPVPEPQRADPPRQHQTMSQPALMAAPAEASSAAGAARGPGDRPTTYPGSLRWRQDTYVDNWPDGLGGTAPLAFVDFPTLCRFKAACFGTATSANMELWHRLRNFEYDPACFEVPAVSRSGRLRHTSSSTAAKRLVRFLTHRRHARGVLNLNLLKAPQEALEDPELQSAFRRMTHLRRAILPWDGWGTPNERLKFLKSLPAGVSFKGCKRDGTLRARGSMGPSDDPSWLEQSTSNPLPGARHSVGTD